MSDLGTFRSVGPVLQEPISSVTATPSVATGTRTTYNGEEYVFFCNKMASAATQGIGLVLSLSSAYSLTRSSTGDSDLVMCFVKHDDVPAGSYAWGLVRGVVQAHFSSTMVTGVPLTIGVNGVVATYTTLVVSYLQLIGRTLSSATANGQGLVYVSCMG